MKSNVLIKDQESLIGLYKTMKPEQRLIAFFNHSRLIHQLYRAGKTFRKRIVTSKTFTKTLSMK